MAMRLLIYVNNQKAVYSKSTTAKITAMETFVNSSKPTYSIGQNRSGVFYLSENRCIKNTRCLKWSRAKRRNKYIYEYIQVTN